MATPSQKKEIRDIFKNLSDYEDAVMSYVLGESSSLDFSASFLDSLTCDALKAEVMSVRSANGSFAEAATLEVIFKFDSVRRDLSMRSKRRSDYYSAASKEYDEEKIRLNAASVNSIQTYSGSTKIQKG